MMGSLDAEFALRFCIWTTTLAAAIIFGHWAWALRRGQISDVNAWAVIPLVSESIKHLAWTVHQFWWTQSWILFVTNKTAHAELQSGRWVVYVVEFVILISMIGVLYPYLSSRFGMAWPFAGCFVIAALYATGYYIGFPS